jgi:DNA-binding CsgD family transcriptional regulator
VRGRRRHVESTLLLERDTQIAVVQAAVDAAAEGAGSLLVIEGPAGIGKTRMLGEAVAIAGDAGFRTLSAYAGELEGGVAYGVVRQLFETLVETAQPDLRRELLGGAADHARPLFEAEPEVPRDDAEEPSFAILHGLYWLAANSSFGRPTLLAIDDLHWADAPSLRWLDYLTRRLDGLPLLVVVAARPPELQGVEVGLTAGLVARAEVPVIRPTPLGSESIARLAFVRSGLELDAAFTAALEQATGGNPLFVTALLDTVTRERIAPTEQGVPKLAAVGAQSVGRFVGLRLARLRDDELALVRAAAVLGDGAPLHLAVSLCDRDPEAVARAGADLVRFELLRREDPIEFTHPVVRSAVYDATPVVERGLAHRRAAELMMRTGYRSEAVAAHALAAPRGADPFIVTALHEAAQRSLAHGAADAAAAYLARALAEQSDEATRAELLVDLGRAERRIDGAAASEHLLAGLQLLHDPGRRADVSLDLGRALWFSDRHTDAVTVFEQALADIDEETERDRYEQLVAELISSSWWEPETYAVAEAQLSRYGRTEAESDVLLATLCHHECRLGRDRERAVELARRALASGRLAASGSPAFSYAGYALTVAGLFDDALSVYNASLAQAHRRGDLFHIASTYMWRGRCQTFRGRLSDAVDDLREATALSIQHGVRVSQPLLVGFLAEALIERGDLEEASRVLLDAGFPETLRPNFLVGFYQLARGRLRVETGSVEQGIGDLRRAGEVAQLVRADNPAFRPWRRWSAEGLRRLGEVDAAKALIQEELELANRWGASHTIGPALRQQGLVIGGDEGLHLLHEAVTTLARSGAPVEHAHALIDLGAALRRSNSRTQARASLREGARIAEESGALGLAERANQELAATGARPRKLLQTGIDALTASERRVANLAAEGLSNKEIAQQLFVTVKTVEVHLSNVFRKLMIDSRGQVAAALVAAPPAAGPLAASASDSS